MGGPAFTSLPQGKKVWLSGAQRLALLQACFRRCLHGEASNYPLPPPSLAKLHLGELGRESGVEWEMVLIGQPNSRCHGGEAAGGAAWPGVRSRQPCLPLPFSHLLSQTSHMYWPPAQLLRDSPVGRSPCIVCEDSEDPRCPEGPRSPRPSIHGGSARARSPPPPLGSPRRTEHRLSGSRAPGRP